MMTIYIPEKAGAEIKYVMGVLLKNILGYQNFRFDFHQHMHVSIPGNDNKILQLAIPFFKELTAANFQYENLTLPENTFDLKYEGLVIPMLYGKPELQLSKDQIKCEADILGSAFFFLTRWEEMDQQKWDERNRFPGKESFAHKNELTRRALVNEYAEFLKELLLKIGTGEPEGENEFEILPSHDVDYPFKTGDYPWNFIVKRAGVQLVKEKSLKQAVNTVRSKVGAVSGNYSVDPYATFNYIMDQSEKNGRKSAFYFISGNHAGTIDGRYAINSTPMRTILKNIANRGHEIGIHGSYKSYNDKEIVQKDLTNLQKALQQAGLKDQVEGNRQHYLRINVPGTFNLLEEAGIKYDTTLGYADMVGFRCGTCTPFPLFNVRERRTMDIYEKPLVLMECSLLDEKYMGLKNDKEAAWQIAHELKETCKKHKGQFTVLWHNHRFLDPFEVELYNSLIA